MLALFALVFQERIDLAGEHRQLAARQVERVGAGRAQEGPIVRHDQAGLLIMPQKVFQQNLRAKIEKVRRFVQQQQVRLVQQQRRQLHPRLPAAGELRDRTLEIIALELELAGHFSALPLGLAAVAHQKIMGRFARQKRIVLPQIAQPQLRMADHFAGIKFHFAQQHAQQRAFPRAIAADKTDLHIVD